MLIGSVGCDYALRNSHPWFQGKLISWRHGTPPKVKKIKSSIWVSPMKEWKLREIRPKSDSNLGTQPLTTSSECFIFFFLCKFSSRQILKPFYEKCRISGTLTSKPVSCLNHLNKTCPISGLLPWPHQHLWYSHLDIISNLFSPLHISGSRGSL